MNLVDSDRFRYLTRFIMSPSVQLKDYKEYNLHITLDEIRYMIFKLSISKSIQNRLLAENRLKELQELYPIEQYPEKWI